MSLFHRSHPNPEPSPYLAIVLAQVEETRRVMAEVRRYVQEEETDE